MTIRDAKPGYKLYFVDRTNLEMREAKIVDVSVPHLDANSLSANKMVCDVRVEDGTTYTMIDSAEIAYVGTKVIATDKRLLANEVENIKAQSEPGG